MNAFPPAPPPPPPPPPPFGGAPVAAPTNGTAIAALTLGILGIACCGLAAPVAIYLGRRAEREIMETPGLQGGGMAKAGFVLGIIGSAIWVVIIGIYVVAAIVGALAS